MWKVSMGLKQECKSKQGVLVKYEKYGTLSIYELSLSGYVFTIEIA